MIEILITSVDSVKAAFGEGEYSWLREELNRMLWSQDNGFECSDNFRCALVGDSLSEEVYEHVAREGCCGQIDIKLGPSPAGREYLYGFNYGH